MKRLISKRQMLSMKRNVTKIAKKKESWPAIAIMMLLLAGTMKQPANAFGDRGLFGSNAATGAIVGGVTGGRKGLGIGLATGAVLDTISAAASDSDSRRNNPYHQLDKEERRLRKLKDDLDRTDSERKRRRLTDQIATQKERISDLTNKLGRRVG